MGQIYSRTSVVIAWLGPRAKYTVEGVKLLQVFYDRRAAYDLQRQDLEDLVPVSGSISRPSFDFLRNDDFVEYQFSGASNCINDPQQPFGVYVRSSLGNIGSAPGLSRKLPKLDMLLSTVGHSDSITMRCRWPRLVSTH